MVDLSKSRASDKVENTRGETEGHKAAQRGLQGAYDISVGPYVDFYNWLMGKHPEYADPVATPEDVGLHSPDQEYDYNDTGMMAATTGFKENAPAYRGMNNPELPSERGNIDDFYQTFLDDPTSMSKYPNAFMEIARAAAATGNKYAPGSGVENKGYTPSKLLRSPEQVEPPPSLSEGGPAHGKVEGDSMGPKDRPGVVKASAGHTFRQSDRPASWFQTLDSEKRYQEYLDATKDLPVDPDAYFKPGYPGTFPEGRPDVLPEEPAVGKGYPYSRTALSANDKGLPGVPGYIPGSRLPTPYKPNIMPDYLRGTKPLPVSKPANEADISGEEGSDTLLGRGKKDTLKSGKVTTTSAYKAFGGPLLRAGKNNDVNQVKEWQQFLADHGYYSGKIDGSFGPRTRAATRLLQSDAGIKGKEVDGIVGPQTKHLAATMGSRSVAAQRGKENFETAGVTAPKPIAEPADTGPLRGPSGRPNNRPMDTEALLPGPQSGPLSRFRNTPVTKAEEPAKSDEATPSDNLVVVRTLPPEPKADVATRFDTELPSSYAAKSPELPEGLTPEEVQRAGRATAPSGTLDPFNTQDPNKDQSRLPTVGPGTTGTGTRGFSVRGSTEPEPNPDLNPAAGTVPASGRIRPEPSASAPLPDISQPPPTTNPNESLKDQGGGFDEGTFGGTTAPTSLGQILSLSGGAQEPPTTAASTTSNTDDIGGLISSASQAEQASQAINATPESSTPSSTPTTTTTTPSTTVTPSSGGQSQMSPAQLGQLIAQATGGMTGDEARASAYSSAYG